MTIGPAWKAQGAWFAALIGTLLVLSFEDAGKGILGLPQSIITLREAFVAILMLCAYLGWSRGLFPGPLHVIDGAPVATLRQRRIAYSVALTIVVAIWLDVARTLLGSVVGDWLELTTEALAAIVLISLYFDVVAPSTRAWIRLAWYAALVITPVAVQGGFIDELLPPRVATWIGQATEAFVAAFFISFYFDVWRRPYGISRLKGEDRRAALLAR